MNFTQLALNGDKPFTSSSKNILDIRRVVGSGGVKQPTEGTKRKA